MNKILNNHQKTDIHTSLQSKMDSNDVPNDNNSYINNNFIYHCYIEGQKLEIYSEYIHDYMPAKIISLLESNKNSFLISYEGSSKKQIINNIFDIPHKLIYLRNEWKNTIFNNNNDTLIGRNIDIMQKDGKYIQGLIIKINYDINCIFIHFDNGKKEWIDLTEYFFKIYHSPNENNIRNKDITNTIENKLNININQDVIMNNNINHNVLQDNKKSISPTKENIKESENIKITTNRQTDEIIKKNTIDPNDSNINDINRNKINSENQKENGRILNEKKEKPNKAENENENENENELNDENIIPEWYSRGCQIELYIIDEKTKKPLYQETLLALKVINSKEIQLLSEIEEINNNGEIIKKPKLITMDLMLKYHKVIMRGLAYDEISLIGRTIEIFRLASDTIDNDGSITNRGINNNSLGGNMREGIVLDFSYETRLVQIFFPPQDTDWIDLSMENFKIIHFGEQNTIVENNSSIVHTNTETNTNTDINEKEIKNKIETENLHIITKMPILSRGQRIEIYDSNTQKYLKYKIENVHNENNDNTCYDVLPIGIPHDTNHLIKIDLKEIRARIILDIHMHSIINATIIGYKVDIYDKIKKIVLTGTIKEIKNNKDQLLLLVKINKNNTTNDTKGGEKLWINIMETKTKLRLHSIGMYPNHSTPKANHTISLKTELNDTTNNNHSTLHKMESPARKMFREFNFNRRTLDIKKPNPLPIMTRSHSNYTIDHIPRLSSLSSIHPVHNIENHIDITHNNNNNNNKIKYKTDFLGEWDDLPMVECIDESPRTIENNQLYHSNLPYSNHSPLNHITVPSRNNHLQPITDSSFYFKEQSFTTQNNGLHSLHKHHTIMNSSHNNIKQHFPPCWYEKIDEHSGLKYWIHSVTHQSQWEAPDWVDHIDDKTGSIYYLNTKTGISQWNMPQSFILIVRENSNNNNINTSNYQLYHDKNHIQISQQQHQQQYQNYNPNTNHINTMNLPPLGAMEAVRQNKIRQH